MNFASLWQRRRSVCFLAVAAILIVTLLVKSDFVSRTKGPVEAGTLIKSDDEIAIHDHYWRSQLEMETVRCDPRFSSFAADTYSQPGPGVDPAAMGVVMTAEELAQFRDHIRVSRSDAWEHAPLKYKAQFRELYRSLGIYD